MNGREPILKTWHEGNLRFEIHKMPDGHTECWFYIRDATPDEAERAVRGASVVHGKLRVFFEGDTRAVEGYARAHGMTILT
jgi:hypothetical protein